MAVCLTPMQGHTSLGINFDRYESMLDWSNDIKHIASSRIGEARTSFRSFAKVIDKLSKTQVAEPEEEEITPTKKVRGKKKALPMDAGELLYDPPVSVVVSSNRAIAD
jgi:hypothetical protein